MATLRSGHAVEIENLKSQYVPEIAFFFSSPLLTRGDSGGGGVVLRTGSAWVLCSLIPLNCDDGVNPLTTPPSSAVLSRVSFPSNPFPPCL